MILYYTRTVKGMEGGGGSKRTRGDKTERDRPVHCWRCGTVTSVCTPNESILTRVQVIDLCCNLIHCIPLFSPNPSANLSKRPSL